MIFKGRQISLARNYKTSLKETCLKLILPRYRWPKKFYNIDPEFVFFLVEDMSKVFVRDKMERN
jgi:hypothetical protein